jgi:hypothetical protein
VILVLVLDEVEAAKIDVEVVVVSAGVVELVVGLTITTELVDLTEVTTEVDTCPSPIGTVSTLVKVSRISIVLVKHSVQSLACREFHDCALPIEVTNKRDERTNRSIEGANERAYYRVK